MNMTAHWLIAPILLPLLAGASMLLLDERRRTLKATLNVLVTSALVLLAAKLLLHAQAAPVGAGEVAGVYQLANWPAPFGIVLVLDRLSALMLLLTSVLALCSLVFSLARWHRAGPHFHPLFQLLLVGLNGAFLTGDLFNLFVFFEVLLVASYGLLLHGSGSVRVKASLHYIAVNLVASLLFLIGVALIYGVTGTLNMADLALRIPEVASENRMLLEAGAGVLGVAFLVKAAMWPLGFWLPSTYAAATAPVAALFAIMSKVGVYVVLRLWLLLFGVDSGDSAHFGSEWLLAGGVITIVFGSVGALASQDLSRLAGFCVIISSGTLLAVIATGDVAVVAAALFYLVSSTLALSALFLLVELAERGRRAGADILAVTLEAFGEFDEESLEYEDIGTAIPATMAMLGLSFVCCALLISGLPPLSGFIAKFALLRALLDPLGFAGSGVIPLVSWLLMAVLLISSLGALIAMTRAGIRAFWAPLGRSVPRVRVIEMAPILLLLLLCATLTVKAEAAMRYLQATAQAVYAPSDYIHGVLSAPRVAAPHAEGEP